MARNKQGLTTRQSKFLNTLAPGRMTVEQVERHLGLACYTLRRWMEQPKFLKAWARTNQLLRLRRGADDAIRDGQAAGTSDAPPAAIAPIGASELNATIAAQDDDGDAAPRATRSRAPAAPPPPKSDRDLIRLRHGEEAARAFEDLLRRHAPANNNPPPMPPAHPPGDASPASTDLPPPAVAQPVEFADAS